MTKATNVYLHVKVLEAIEERATAAGRPFTREVNRLLDSGEQFSGTALAALDDVYQELGGRILGILRDVGAVGEREIEKGLGAHLIEAFIETRARLREANQYDLADDIRKRLADLGITLKDDPEGTTWEYR